MATEDGQGVGSLGDSTIEHVPIPATSAGQFQPMQSTPNSSTPVEMTRIDQHLAADTTPGLDPVQAETPPQHSQEKRIQESHPTAATSSDEIQSPATIETSSTNEPSTQILTPPLKREQTAPAIGSSSDNPTPIPKESELVGPTLIITLLLTSGARHPYKIDEKYLQKRNVNVEDNNPVNMSVYTLKELIWREWREEWEARPSSPSSIRIIYYGKMLEDKALLQDCKFENGTAPHVVHMTIKPPEITDDEDGKGSKHGGRDRDGNDRAPRCRCIIL